MGSTKYKRMIHDHNSKNKHVLDQLPFTFPKKAVVRSNTNVVVACVECGYQHSGNEHTVGFCCPECKQYRQVTNPEAEKRGIDLDFRPGFFATASDILRMKEEQKEEKSQ
jgi:predicted Zn-ribbon and HTH transcriptional regulator